MLLDCLVWFVVLCFPFWEVCSFGGALPFPTLSHFVFFACFVLLRDFEVLVVLRVWPLLWCLGGHEAARADNDGENEDEADNPAGENGDGEPLERNLVPLLNVRRHVRGLWQHGEPLLRHVLQTNSSSRSARARGLQGLCGCLGGGNK